MMKRCLAAQDCSFNSVILCLDLAAQLVEEIAWLAPNAWSITHECSWFGHFVAICCVIRWSMLNLVRSRGRKEELFKQSVWVSPAYLPGT